jgi:hypothetical protein
MSAATPKAGLAVMPELPSEPPHSRPTINSLAGTDSRRTSFTRGSNSATLRTAASTVLTVPPKSCIENTGTPPNQEHAVDLHQPLAAQQMIGRRLLAAQPDQQISAYIGVRNSGQHPIQHLVGLHVERHAAAGGVSERDHPVDVWKIGSSALASNRRATYLLTEAEQLTIEITAR